jgi:hypothetical protein
MSFGRLGALGRGFGRLGSGGKIRTVVPGIITASGGSFLFTGSDASLLAQRKIAANSGSFSFTGSDASLLASAKTVAANAGAFLFSGDTMTPLQDYKIPAASGSFSFTGADATLTKSSSGPTFTFVGKEANFFNPATSATFTTIDIGTAAADRYVIVAIWNQNARAIDSVTVGGVSLAEDVENTSTRGLSIFSGLVTTGSGVQNIVAAASAGGIFEDVTIFCWTGTGLADTTGAVQTANASATTSTTISVTAGDFLIALLRITANNSGSTETPTSRTQAGIGTSIVAHIFEWNTVASTNASFTIGADTTEDIIAAAYR